MLQKEFFLKEQAQKIFIYSSLKFLERLIEPKIFLLTFLMISGISNVLYQ